MCSRPAAGWTQEAGPSREPAPDVAECCIVNPQPTLAMFGRVILKGIGAVGAQRRLARDPEQPERAQHEIVARGLDLVAELVPGEGWAETSVA